MAEKEISRSVTKGKMYDIDDAGQMHETTDPRLRSSIIRTHVTNRAYRRGFDALQCQCVNAEGQRCTRMNEHEGRHRW